MCFLQKIPWICKVRKVINFPLKFPPLLLLSRCKVSDNADIKVNLLFKTAEYKNITKISTYKNGDARPHQWEAFKMYERIQSKTIFQFLLKEVVCSGFRLVERKFD